MGGCDSMELFHCTNKENLKRIQDSGLLCCSLSLMSKEERKTCASKIREGEKELSGGILRCHHKNIHSAKPEYIKHLNGHVFFWPTRVNESFYRLFPNDILLRCNLSDLKENNPVTDILFSDFNTGATKDETKRNVGCFRSLSSSNGEKLVEVVVQGEVCLPGNTKWKEREGNWRKLFSP